MSLLPKVFLKSPKSSNFDLSRASRFTAAPGLLYPVLIEDCLPGDKIKLNLGSLIKTYPLLSPLMGQFKVQFDVFYSPWKNYVKQMHSNTTKFDPLQSPLPYIHISPQNSDVEIPWEACTNRPGTLNDFMGIPVGFNNCYSTDDPGSGSDDIKLSAMRYLAYYDIVRNYYTDPQSPDFAFMYHGAVRSFDRSTLDNQYQTLLTLSNTDSLNRQWGSSIGAGTGFADLFGSNSFSTPNGSYSFQNMQPLDGLCLRTYKPDINSAWLSTGTFNSVQTRTKVSTSSQSFTIDQLRTANKLTKYLERTMVAGGRYDDYVRANYGVSDRSDLMIPEFFGSSSTSLTFEDVVATAESSNTPLGSLAGRGYGLLGSRNHYLNVKNHGTLIVIMSLVPVPDYYEGMHPNLLKTSMTDVFAPSLDNLGFQPKMLSTLSAQAPRNSNGKIAPWSTWRPFDQSVGEQPAWSEYTSAVNELHGECTNTLKYWTLARPFSRVTGSGQVVSPLPSNYIYPYDYNYAFADTSSTAQNFIVQCSFGLKMRRCISKSVMPSLG